MAQQEKGLGGLSEEQLRALAEGIREGKFSEYPYTRLEIRGVAERVMLAAAHTVSRLTKRRMRNNSEMAVLLSASEGPEVQEIARDGETWGARNGRHGNRDIIIFFPIDPDETLLEITGLSERAVKSEEFINYVLNSMGQSLGFLGKGKTLDDPGNAEMEDVTPPSFSDELQVLRIYHPLKPYRMEAYRPIRVVNGRVDGGGFFIEYHPKTA